MALGSRPKRALAVGCEPGRFDEDDPPTRLSTSIDATLRWVESLVFTF